MKKSITITITAAILAISAPVSAANLANPAAQIGGGRLAFGLSYYLGGADITNMEIPMMINRVNARVGFSPVKYVNFGLDIGTTQASVDLYSVNGRDTVPVFEGGYGLSAGGHVKLTTPYIGNVVSFVGIGTANYFRSDNQNNAYYGGFDVTAAAGLQFRIPETGTISIGPQFYYIDGKNRDADRNSGSYRNVNNLRAWIAFDFFPDASVISENQTPYASIEFTASPNINGSKRAPIREFSVSVSIGTITNRLFGVGE